MSSECTVFSCFIKFYRLRVSPSHYINTVRMWRVAARLLCRCPPYILAVAPRTLLKLATPLLNLFEQYAVSHCITDLWLFIIILL